MLYPQLVHLTLADRPQAPHVFCHLPTTAKASVARVCSVSQGFDSLEQLGGPGVSPRVIGHVWRPHLLGIHGHHLCPLGEDDGHSGVVGRVGLFAPNGSGGEKRDDAFSVAGRAGRHQETGVKPQQLEEGVGAGRDERD